MVDLKFVFSNISSRPNPNITLRPRTKSTLAKRKQTEISITEEEKKKTPLFYQHKIRAPKYEYF